MKKTEYNAASITDRIPNLAHLLTAAAGAKSLLEEIAAKPAEQQEEFINQISPGLLEKVNCAEESGRVVAVLCDANALVSARITGERWTASERVYLIASYIDAAYRASR